jgi:L-rhamnose isomerase
MGDVMIHDMWFTIVLCFMFILVIIFRVVAIVVGTKNTIAEGILKSMLEVNKLSRETL